MISPAASEKVKALAIQINHVYREDRMRPSNATCDICGAGDKQGKNAVYKIRTVVHGYESRPYDSPNLCHKHGTGWALTFNTFNPMNTRTPEEIDLHFAMYLAKKLLKESENA